MPSFEIAGDYGLAGLTVLGLLAALGLALRTVERIAIIKRSMRPPDHDDDDKKH